MVNLQRSPPLSMASHFGSFMGSPPPEQGILATNRIAASSTHAKLHKRGNSASSVPFSPSLTESRSVTPQPTFDESWDQPKKHQGSGVKIKPYLRKLQIKENNTIDLSRPAAENEGLAGLGIQDYSSASKTASDVAFSPIGARGKHHRSASNTSHLSSSSGITRPSATYVHPMRQTPRPYTPPVAKSYPTSVVGLEDPEEAGDIMTDEEFRYRQYTFDPSRRSGSISSVPTGPSGLHLQASSSTSRLGASQSTTSLTLSASAGRSRGDTMKSVEIATSPSSRPSLDKAFSWVRGGGHDSPVDPASRAASVYAARQAFNAKEEAKDRKAEKEAMRQHEREERRRREKEERQRRKSDAQSRRGTISNEKIDPLQVAGKEYTRHNPVHHNSLPAHGTVGGPKRSAQTATAASTRRSPKSAWLAFVTWLRTRFLRLGRKLRLTS